MDRYEALKHAAKAHAGQIDKCGKPYILHPIAVAEAIERLDEDCVVVALLHDVYEDTDYPWLYNDLNPVQSGALRVITRIPSEPYWIYIQRVCTSTTAAVVKLADLWHNLQPERQFCLPATERESLEARYLKARNRIWEALGDEWWPGEERTDG